MQTSDFIKVPPLNSREDPGGSCFVRVQKRDLERLCTEVMQLREFLPKVINGDFLDALYKSRFLDTLREQSQQQQHQLKQECLHLNSRLHAAQSECQKEREEKLVLRERLWESREQLQQQAEFCTELGAATCTVLWSASRREEAVRDILADGKLEPFLSVAGQTLESFVKSLDEEEKPEQQNYNSNEHQFVLALAGVITNRDSEVCLQALRLLQSLLVESDILAQNGPDLQPSLPMERIHQLASSRHSALRQTALEILEDIKCLIKTQRSTPQKEQ
ncbi:Heat shock factor 2-binding protein [Bagarius yarrelli]|uniref:Heat shock factor 2-binding protein n=1 Tax=Bagarius yarrelli TaxID=175774 RepID=A0A556TKK0_BAGYA|nr:Heat shock factor 2-binding protein [Bagarius yarrelli]